MKTWDEYKEYINKTDLIAKEILDEAEKDVISHEIIQGVNQAILYEQGKTDANVTVLSNGQEDKQNIPNDHISKRKAVQIKVNRKKSKKY